MQFPNMPLWFWFGGTILAKLFSHGRPHSIFVWSAFIGLVVWAIWELLAGDNYFRRLLGAIALIMSIINRV